MKKLLKYVPVVASLAATVDQLSAMAVDGLYLSNEHRIQFGEMGALQGGAVTARVNDPSAAWYNPARLGFITAPSISGNASMYESANITLEKPDHTENISQINSIAGFFGVAGYSPFDAIPDLRWGFAIATPLKWEVNYKSAETVTAPAPLGRAGTTTSDQKFVAQNSESILCPMFSLGWKAGDNTAIGLGILMPIYESRVNQLWSLNSVGGQYFETSWNDQRQQVYAYRLSFGVSHDFDPITVSIAGKTRTKSFRSSNDAQFHDVIGVYSPGNAAYSGHEDAYVSGGEAEHVSPNEVALGVAFVKPVVSLECNVTYLGHQNEYSTVSGTMQSTSILYDTMNFRQWNASQVLIPETIELRSRVNVAVGGDVTVSDRIKIGTGFFTDRSQNVVDASSHLNLDIYGLTFGGVYSVNKNSSVFASVYRQWTNNSASARTKLTPEVIGNDTDVQISVIGMTLGSSYFF